MAWALLGLFLMLTLAPGLAATPDESECAWKFDYTVPDDDVTYAVVTLSYRWWNPKVDGDLASKKVLLAAQKVEIKPGQKSFPVQVLLNGEKSVVTVNGQLLQGKGFSVNASYKREPVPKLNSNGFYVLAKIPINPKDPSSEPSAWIELGIDPQVGGK